MVEGREQTAILTIKIDRFHNPLRGHPAFQALLRKTGLE
jgi:hypothetical protein